MAEWEKRNKRNIFEMNRNVNLLTPNPYAQ